MLRYLRFARSSKAPVLPVYIDARNSALFYGASMLYKPLATMLLVQEMFKQKHKSISMRIGELIPYDSFASLPFERRPLSKCLKNTYTGLAKTKPPC